MNTIKVYINNLFEQLPKTDEIAQIKEELLQNMEDKYDELLASGVSENEAIGMVITDFGNIDELVEAFGVTNKNTANAADVTSDKTVWNVLDVRNYIEAHRKTKVYVAIGVFIIMAAVAFLVANSMTDRGVMIGLVSLIILVATAVGIFIYAHGLVENTGFVVGEVAVSTEAQKYLTVYEREQKKKAVLPTAIGVIICIVSPLLIIVPSFNEAIAEQYIVLLTAALIVCIAVAVFIFIIFNSYKTTVDKLLCRGEYSEEQRAREEKMGPFAGFWWLCTTALFLGYSLITKDWGRSWIIWPVSALLFAGISALFAGFRKKD